MDYALLGGAELDDVLDDLRPRLADSLILELDAAAHGPASRFARVLRASARTRPLAIVVEDSGCVVGANKWIDTGFTPEEAKAAVDEMLAGSGGSNSERALMLMEAAIAESGAGGCNEGLVRDDAQLHLVAVSDEPDQSSNDYSFYIALFQSFKDDPNDVVIHAVGGDYPGGCGDAAAYIGIYEATVVTGGRFCSICATDWQACLVDLAEEAAALKDRFTLRAIPLKDSIAVRIDGAATTEGWQLVGDVLFFGPCCAPPAGAIIEVEYALKPSCPD